MKYQQPYGITDPNAPYINGDPSVGRQGSIPPAAAFEDPMRELVELIQSASLTPTDQDLTQITQAVRSQHMNYAIATNTAAGTQNAIAIAFNPTARRLGAARHAGARESSAGQRAGHARSRSMGLSARSRKWTAPNSTRPTFRGGAIFEAIWDDTYWSMTNFMGLGGGTGVANTYITKIPYVKDTGTVANHIIAPFVPAITTVVPGDAIEVTLKNSITGPTDIVVNAMAAKAVVRPNGAPLSPGDAVAGQVMLLILSETGVFQFFGIIPQAFSGLGTPIGCIILSVGNVAPLGTLKLNGALLNRAEHPGLWTFANASGRIVDEAIWQVAGNRMWPAFSRGDGISTFRLPEFRGEYMRFFDDAHGVDVGRVLGAQQFDTVGNFTVSGVVNIDNPKVTMTWAPGPGPTYPYTTYEQAHWVEDAELAWNQPQGNLVPPPPCYVGDTSDWGSPYNLNPYHGGEVEARVGETNAHNVTFVSPFRTDRGPALGIPPVKWPDPQPFIHRNSRLYGNMTLSGGGGGQETRPRNVAVTACIVDG